MIVTGGSSGIGRAIAVRFASAGARVMIADLSADPWHGGQPTHELIEAAGGVARFVLVDVSQSAAVDSLVQRTVDEFGRLDVVVNNAAISVAKSLLETTDDDWNRVMSVNLTGVFLMCRSAVRQMMTQPIDREVRGRIVNISSQHGMVAAPEDIAYGTSKSGIIYLTKQIALDYARRGIVCNSVAPGKIETAVTERSSDARWLNYWHSRTPWPRLGRPEDVASAALFLASSDASFVTGTTILVDGGWIAS